MEVAYLTDGINWHAEYVAAVAEDEKSLGPLGLGIDRQPVGRNLSGCQAQAR